MCPRIEIQEEGIELARTTHSLAKTDMPIAGILKGDDYYSQRHDGRSSLPAGNSWNYK